MNTQCIVISDNCNIGQALAKELGAQYVFIRDHAKLNDNLFSLCENKAVVAITENRKLSSLVQRLGEANAATVCVFPTESHRSCCSENLISVDFTKPRLDYVEIPITDFCNLKCTGCCEMSNLCTDVSFIPLDSFERDLRQLKKLFWGVGKVRIMGGEPTLNPKISEYVRTVRDIFPDADIRIVSNGLLIPSLDRDILTNIKSLGCSFDISAYAPTRKVLRKIKSVLKCFGIHYHISPVFVFFKAILEKPNSQPEISYRNCAFTHCHALRNGHLSSCSYCLLAERLNAHFGTSYPTNDYFDIYSTELDGWLIVDKFSSAHEFCKFCSPSLVPFKWSDVTSHEPCLDDWVVRNTFVNTKLLAVVTVFAKPVVVTLRNLIQKE